MKIYIIRFNDKHAYIEEIEYSDYHDKYEKTKGILPERIFEESQLDIALERVYQLNRL